MYPQPELFKDAPGISRAKHTKLYLYENKYGTDVIWYHTKSNVDSKESCSMEMLEMMVLYTQADLFTASNPPTTEQLEHVGSTRSIICGTCGFHVWFYGKGVDLMGNALAFVKRQREIREKRGFDYGI